MKEIGLFAGADLDMAIEILKKEAEQASEPCFCKFNGEILYSTDTVDESYMNVLGKTKAEFEEEQRKRKEEHDRAEREHQARIPQLTEKYRNEARGLVLDSELEYWDEIVPIRLGDLYHGMELQQVLDCCKIMRDESLVYAARLEKAYDVFMAAGHSGASANLTMSMLARFCPHGNELADACRDFRFEKNKRAMKAIYKKTGEVVEIECYGNDGSYTVFRNSKGELINLPISFFDNFEEIVESAKIDWEQRRYEIAKEILPNAAIAVNAEQKEWMNGMNYQKASAILAINYADALIAELKKKE